MTEESAVRSRLRARPSRKLFALLAAAVAALLLSACHYVGSGTITSATGKGKATFTFDVNCSPSGTSSGLLTYVDNNAHVMIHAVGGPTSMATTCQQYTPPIPIPYEEITGTYTPLKGGTGGTFQLVLFGGGTSYSSPGGFAIELTGGIYNGYENEGEVTKGNVVVNP